MVAQKLSKELEKAQENLDNFTEQAKAAGADLSQNFPVNEVEQQTQLSTKEINKDDGLVLKPTRTLGSREPFNEVYRKQFEYGSERVRFIAENYEIIGDTIELWTKKFPGQPAEFWTVPVNKVVIGPRYLAEQIATKSYIRLKTEDAVTSSTGNATFTGQVVASHKVQRLDARPAEGFNRSSKFRS